MKKLLIFLLPALFHLPMAQAQEVSYGFNVGFNYYSYFTENDEGENELAETDFDTNVQYHIGGYLEVPFGSDLGLVNNLVYQNRSVEIPQSRSLSLNYLDINPLLKYSLEGDYGQGFYLKGGARYSFLFSAKLFENQEDVSDQFENGNFGINLGIGNDISSTFAAEFMLDYSPSDFSENFKSKLVGLQFRFIIDLQELLPT